MQHCKVVPDSGIKEIIRCGNRNPRLWHPEFSSRNLENPTNNTLLGCTVLDSTVKESRIQYLTSRIQDCLGLPYMGKSLSVIGVPTSVDIVV